MGLPPQSSDEFMKALYAAQNQTDSGRIEASDDLQHQAQVNTATLNAKYEDSRVNLQSKDQQP